MITNNVVIPRLQYENLVKKINDTPPAYKEIGNVIDKVELSNSGLTKKNVVVMDMDDYLKIYTAYKGLQK